MAHRSMRRQVMESKFDSELREKAGKVYKAIGMELPPERAHEQKMVSRSHGGFELVSTFVPTPEAPKLNVVHGPLANKGMMRLPKDVVGFPIIGSATRARKMAHRTISQKSMDLDGDDAEELANTPYFYPRRARKSGSITKRRRERPQRRTSKSRPLEIEASA